jgi:hypothetical protein
VPASEAIIDMLMEVTQQIERAHDLRLRRRRPRDPSKAFCATCSEIEPRIDGSKPSFGPGPNGGGVVRVAVTSGLIHFFAVSLFAGRATDAWVEHELELTQRPFLPDGRYLRRHVEQTMADVRRGSLNVPS